MYRNIYESIQLSFDCPSAVEESKIQFITNNIEMACKNVREYTTMEHALMTNQELGMATCNKEN